MHVTTSILGGAVLGCCLLALLSADNSLDLRARTIHSSAGAHCGTERWPVKTMTDADANKVILTPEDASIRDLTSLQAPSNPDAYLSRRFPAELQAYRVHATMTLIKREADHDYHIVLSDSAGTTMIVEAPDPACAKGSLAASQIVAVRSAIDAKLGSIGKRPGHTKKAVTVTGVLFFDKIHGQTGVAKNGVELHPILAIEFH